MNSGCMITITLIIVLLAKAIVDYINWSREFERKNRELWDEYYKRKEDNDGKGNNHH